MKKIIKILIFVLAVIGIGFLLSKCKPRLSGELRREFNIKNPSDSTMIESRQIGNINLDKFIALALQANKSDFDTTCTQRYGDTILFIVKEAKMFFGADKGDWWTKKYKNLPIQILENNSFKAKINEISGREYIYIPYHILSCLVDFIGENNTANSTQKTIQKDVNGNDITFQEEDIANVDEKGTKIQTGGWVFKNVSDIITQSGDKGGNKEKQLEILWNYARPPRWNYINDPAGTVDTWRSASETIETYYFTSAKKYTGDCDDFAILMASFARQVGLNSRFVCAVGKGGGHAYAEYQRESDGKWIPMDWFSNEFGGKPFEGRRVKVIENL